MTSTDGEIQTWGPNDQVWEGSTVKNTCTYSVEGWSMHAYSQYSHSRQHTASLARLAN